MIPALLALSASVLVQRVRPRALRWSLVALLVATGLAHDATGWLRGRAVFELPYFTYLQSITRPHCIAAGLPYREESPFEAVASVTRHLRQIASDAGASSAAGV